MTSGTILAIFAVACLSLLPARALSAQVIIGAVENESGRSIAGAQVSVIGSESTVTTDSAGRFELRPSAGTTQILQVRRLGFVAVTAIATVRAMDTLRLSIEMFPSTVSLETMRIEAAGTAHKLSRVGFVKRRQRSYAGDSRFVTRAEFDRQNPRNLREIVRRMAGFNTRCEWEPKTIVIDGVPIPPPVRQSLRDSLDALDQAPNRNDPYEVILPANIEAIEAYAGPSEAPAQFSVNRCVLLIWTRN